MLIRPFQVGFPLFSLQPLTSPPTPFSDKLLCRNSAPPGWDSASSEGYTYIEELITLLFAAHDVAKLMP
jgi:hypothetical protein